MYTHISDHSFLHNDDLGRRWCSCPHRCRADKQYICHPFCRNLRNILPFLRSIDTHFSQWISHGNTRLTIRGSTAFMCRNIFAILSQIEVVFFVLVYRLVLRTRNFAPLNAYHFVKRSPEDYRHRTVATSLEIQMEM